LIESDPGEDWAVGHNASPPGYLKEKAARLQAREATFFMEPD